MEENDINGTFVTLSDIKNVNDINEG